MKNLAAEPPRALLLQRTQALTEETRQLVRQARELVRESDELMRESEQTRRAVSRIAAPDDPSPR